MSLELLGWSAATLILTVFACGLTLFVGRALFQMFASVPAQTSRPIFTPTLVRTPSPGSAPQLPITPATPSPTAPPAVNALALLTSPAATLHSPPNVASTLTQPVAHDATPLAPPASTLTPTAPPNSPNASPEPTSPATPTPPAPLAPLATPTLPNSPTSTPTGVTVPTPTATFALAAWSFMGVRLYPNPAEGNLLVFGDVVNYTGLTQELSAVTGAFYDVQGQRIALPDGSSDYWPFGYIPPGGRVPFELIVADVQDVASVNLSVTAQPSGEVVRQDFEFSALNAWSQDSTYCVGGVLRNRGSQLQEYLVIAAVLYDAQNNVVNFGDSYQPDPGVVAGDATLNFNVCVDPPNSDVARYELRAWGH